MSGFSDKLKQCIDKCGVPIAELASSADLSASMLYKIQSGSRLPDSLRTLERLMDAMLCALPEKRELIQAYRVERIGQGRYDCFQEFKGMLRDISGYQTVQAGRLGGYGSTFPMAIHGGGNVNAVIRSVLEQETLLEGGMIDMMIPFRNTYCLSVLSQVLLDCNPKFGRVRHMFTLRASAADDAMLENMKAIRAMLPRLITMIHYEPYYCYLTDPGIGASMFPYGIITSQAVLLLTADFQFGIYITDSESCSLYRQQFSATLAQFHPLMRGGKGGFTDYLMMYSHIQSRMTKVPRPVVIAAQPCILPCLPFDRALKFAPPEVLEDPGFRGLVDTFFSQSSENGYTSYFTMEGLLNLLRTGKLMELLGSDIPPMQKEDVILCLEEMLRRAKAGNITLHVFREDLFQGKFNMSLALYDPNTLLVGFEMPERDYVFSDINEATLCRVVKEYTDHAPMLGDVFPEDVSIQMTEHTLYEYIHNPEFFNLECMTPPGPPE